jgi:hypothetical protein
MKLGKWKLFGSYFRTYSSDAYNDTMSAVERLARDSILVLNRKPEDERREILARAQIVTERISETFDNEAPMVAAIGLLTAVRVLEQMIKNQAAK